MRSRQGIACLAVLALLAGDLFAQGRGGGGRRRMSWQALVEADADGNGKLSREEFTGPDRFWDRLDGDGDGFLTESEHTTMMERRGGGQAPGRGRVQPRAEPEVDVFDALDEDGDGQVSEEELGRVLAEADADENGTLARDELEDWLTENGTPGVATVGQAAPEFALSRLDTRRRSAGDVERLSSLAGQPVFLAFGSYT